MADTFTPNYNLTKPQVGASTDTWGDKLNLNFDALDTALFALDQAAVKLTGNQTIAGIKTFSSNPISSAAQGTDAGALTRRDFVLGLDAANVKLTGDQTIAGVKTFSSPIAGSTTTQVSLTGNQTIGGVKTFASDTNIGFGTSIRFITAGGSSQAALNLGGDNILNILNAGNAGVRILNQSGSAELVLLSDSQGNMNAAGTISASQFTGPVLVPAPGHGNGVFAGNGDAATSAQANLQIRSWFGIGFAPSIAGNPVPQNENAVWIDTRTGNLGARGAITAPTFNGNLNGNVNGTAANATNVTGVAGQLGFSLNQGLAFGGRGGPEVTGQGAGAAMMSFHRPGAFACNFGLDQDNSLRVGGWSFGNQSFRILHEGNWRDIIGAADVGQVGTYVMANTTSTATIEAGNTVAGSTLRASNAATFGGVSGRSATTFSGTWRCMGNTNYRNGVVQAPAEEWRTTLWLRIS